MDGGTNWTQIISVSVVPVVIISACGLLCLTFYNRMAMVVSRLRGIQRERLDLFRELASMREKKENEVQIHEGRKTLHALSEQTEIVLQRAKLLRSTLLCFLGTIAALAVTSLLLALSLFIPLFNGLVIFFFVFGLFLLLYGVYFAFRELLQALKPIEKESNYVTGQIKEHPFAHNE